MPNDLVGHLVGKARSHLRTLRKRTGAAVDVAQREALPTHLAQRVVTVSAGLREVILAVAMIHRRLAKVFSQHSRDQLGGTALQGGAPQPGFESPLTLVAGNMVSDAASAEVAPVPFASVSGSQMQDLPGPISN